MSKRTSTTTMRERLLERILREESLYLVLGIVIGLLLNNFLVAISPDNVIGFLDDLLPEAVGIIFTVFILDQLNSWRQESHVREQMIRRAHSRYKNTALAAIEELRVAGYLEDGILRGTNMRGSNWEDANLYRADLRDVDLRNVRLYKADLVQANLLNAQVTDEQLASTDIMYGATLPDGTTYDGRYRLPGDFAYALREGINTDSDEAMAAWFGISLTQYEQSQAWADEYLHQFTLRSSSHDDSSDSI